MVWRTLLPSTAGIQFPLAGSPSTLQEFNPKFIKHWAVIFGEKKNITRIMLAKR